MADELREVECHPHAYHWICDDCGRKNYGEMIVAEFAQEERQEIIEETGELPQTGDWLIIPDEVECSHCGSKFKAKHPHE